ncbi:MAG: hypothetical protein GYA17_13615 [Chloroflexi bacterium]|nr:hypothetical protein [Chloroflexota bacterium]
MLDPPKPDDVQRLMRYRGFPAVSILIPTEGPGETYTQNPIRLKNALRQAEQALNAAGVKTPEIERLLAPAQSLFDDPSYWMKQGRSLALYLGQGIFQAQRLAIAVDEQVLVNDRFQIKPLLPALQTGGDFYVLALSQNQVRFFEATRHSIRPVAVEGMPTSRAEALPYEDPEKQLQFHTRTQNRRGERDAVFHGHGVGDDDEKDTLLRFCRRVDEGLGKAIRGSPAPLVLAGVEYLHPIYRQANSYPNLLREGIHGNPEEMQPRELHRRAWELVRTVFERQLEEIFQRHHTLGEKGLASNDLRAILPAAYYGRVATLLVALDRELWGQFDPEHNTLQLHSAYQPGRSDDLLDQAVVQTWANNGRIYVLPAEHMPDGNHVAAIFRYPVDPQTLVKP